MGNKFKMGIAIVLILGLFGYFLSEDKEQKLENDKVEQQVTEARDKQEKEARDKQEKEARDKQEKEAKDKQEKLEKACVNSLVDLKAQFNGAHIYGGMMDDNDKLNKVVNDAQAKIEECKDVNGKEFETLRDNASEKMK